MRFAHQRRRLAECLLIAALLGACGSSGGGDGDTGAEKSDPSSPVLGGGESRATATPGPVTPSDSPDLGFPAAATKNTTRVGGTDPLVNAAAIARIVFPARSRETRPGAVSVVDADDWRTAISAAQLMSRPIRAPVLFSRRGALPTPTSAALEALAPTGSGALGGAQAIPVGGGAAPPRLRVREITGNSYAARARAIDRLQTAASGRPSRAVLVAPADDPAAAMPAAGWAAKSGTPVLWVTRTQIPAATRDAIRDHGRPAIHLLGSESAIGRPVARALAELGTVRRIPGADAVTTAVAFARYSRAGFGWNAVDPGHGYVFARTSRPLDAAAAAPLSASGTYGPLLLLSSGDRLDKPVEDYLLDVQPGYQSDPVRGVYNHGWLVSDVASISIDVQSRIDALLEIQPVDPERSVP